MGDAPATSTVRNALAVTAAVDDLLRPGREGRLLDADTAVDAVVTIIEESGGLRPHQVRDVIDHLQNRCADGALSPPSQTVTLPLTYETVRLPTLRDEGTADDQPVTKQDIDRHATPEPDPDVGPLGEGRQERATAAVDELAARVNQGTPEPPP